MVKFLIMYKCTHLLTYRSKFTNTVFKVLGKNTQDFKNKFVMGGLSRK